MKSRATISLGLLPALLLLFAAVPAQAQDADPLGDEFIFFVNGPNVLVPEFNGEVVADPKDPASGNQVAKFNHGDFNLAGFRFVRTEGVDMTQNIADGDNLYLRLLSDPANAGQPNVTLTFTDKTDDSGANDGTADLEFRVQWVIPQELHDGEWHDLVIPLPPATWQELEDAKMAGSLDPVAENWVYGGAWSTGGFPVALDGQGPNTSQAPELFQEFEWDNVSVIGVFFDHNTGTGGPIWLDDVYIGSDDTDISVAQDPPAAMSGVSFDAHGQENLISWTPNPDFGGYNVYASADPITDVDDPSVILIATVPFNAEDFSVAHQLEVPHPSLAPLAVNYAVTSTSAFGVENKDVSNSSGEVANDELANQAYIIQLTEDESETIFNNLSEGVASGEGFPDGIQFQLDSAHSSVTAGDGVESDADNSGTFWLGYFENELFIYAEVLDDVIEFAANGTSGGETWNYDSIEIGWGNYDVRDVEGGGILTGSPRQDMGRGETADYQFRMTGFFDSEGNIVSTSTFVAAQTIPGEAHGEIQGGGTVVDFLTDDAGNTIGWKALSLIPLNNIQYEDDAVVPTPGTNELRLMPFSVTLNDADGNLREDQITWSTKGNVDGNWWNTPAQWLTVAMAGRNLALSDDDAPGLPDAFTLSQNYPNPFNPATTISFELASSESVTLTIFDVLGRRVATLLNGVPMTAGAHQARFDAAGLASGVYLYRLEAGAFAQTRRMLLIK